MASPFRDRLPRLLLRMYPRAWRERYGDELLALIDTRGLSAAHGLDIVRAAAGERAEWAMSVLLGSPRAVAGRVLRRIVRAIGSRLFAPALATAIALAIESLMDATPPPVLDAATWTAPFLVTLLTTTLGIACVSYLAGGAVVWVRRRHSEEAGQRPSMLMSVAVTLVINTLAMHPSHAPGAASLTLINHAFGSNSMVWMFVVQWALPKPLVPWYAGGVSRPA